MSVSDYKAREKKRAWLNRGEQEKHSQILSRKLSYA